MEERAEESSVRLLGRGYLKASDAHSNFPTWPHVLLPFQALRTEVDCPHSHRQIRYFLEPSAVSRATPTTPASLVVPRERSVNKMGHALAVLDPVFHKYTFEDPRIKQVAQDMGKKDPRVLQSMVICKQPKIGGSGGLQRFEEEAPR